MTCKGLNRNGLESQAWFLNSEGFNNILAMTGDYPVTGNEGMAKPVFGIDSVGLISMLNKMNEGLDLRLIISFDRKEALLCVSLQSMIFMEISPHWKLCSKIFVKQK